MGHPVVYFDITGTDGPKLHKFYSELFGWKIHADNEMKYGLVNRSENMSPEGFGIDGGIGQGPEGYPGHVIVYISVPDVEAALAKAVELGGSRVMGPEVMPDGVELGYFTDPAGHRNGLVKSNDGPTEESAGHGPNSGNAVVHFEITGKDGKLIQHFYSDMFDWKIDADNPMNYGMVNREENLSAGGIGIAGGVSATHDGSDGYVTFYVLVPEVEATLVKAEALGGTRVIGPMDVPGGPTLGMFNDPEGHLIGVMQ